MTAVFSHSRGKRDKGRETEGGFSLAVVLAFVGLVAGIIAYNAYNNLGALNEEKAKAAGWHLAQVAKAARLYMRDYERYTGTDPVTQKTLIADSYNAATPVAIPVNLADLINAGLLPSGFPVQNTLGQNVSVYQGIWPIDGDPADSSTFLVSYVYLDNSDLTGQVPMLMQHLMEGAQQNEVYAGAPLFSGTDNISGDCDANGQPDVVIWDTACLNEAEFIRISGRAEFNPGALMIPAWKSYNHDMRAIMRFPQPENTGYATMLTSLEMGTPDINAATGDCNKVTVHNYVSNDPADRVETDICDVIDDEGAAMDNDRRFDIANISSMEARTIIAANQGADEVSTGYDMTNTQILKGEYDFAPDDLSQRSSINASAGTEVVFVNGALNAEGDFWVTGKMPKAGLINENRVRFSSTTDGSGRDLEVAHNVNVNNQSDASSMNMEVYGNANIRTGYAQSPTLRSDASFTIPALMPRGAFTNTDVAGRVGVAESSVLKLDINACDAAVAGSCGMSADTINMTSPNSQLITDKAAISIIAAEDLDVSDSADPYRDDPDGEYGDAGLPRLIALDTDVAGDVTAREMVVNQTLEVLGNATLGSNAAGPAGPTYVTLDCQSPLSTGCPDISEDPGDAEVE